MAGEPSRPDSHVIGQSPSWGFIRVDRRFSAGQPQPRDPARRQHSMTIAETRIRVSDEAASPSQRTAGECERPTPAKLTDDQRRQFERDGFLVVPEALSPAMVERLLA